VTAEPVVEFDGVMFAYDRPPVLEDVTLTVRQGDFISIVGPNGGGKTTMLKLILGLLSPDRGSIRVLGLAPQAARHRVGYVPQYHQFDPKFPVNVLDVVLMGRLRRGWSFGTYSRKDRRAADEALRQVDMADLRRRSFSDLSGGQRQRVLIARALASGPELLLLDEPTANVDVRVLDDLGDLLQRINGERTIVLVSHDIWFVSQLTKHVVCVNRRVHIHPADQITDELIAELFGAELRAVRHDVHHCKRKDATCSNS
jgi:zinc transport system ATP-binding protein